MCSSTSSGPSTPAKRTLGKCFSFSRKGICKHDRIRGEEVGGVPFSQGVQDPVNSDDCKLCGPCPKPTAPQHLTRNLDSANSLELVRYQWPLEPRLETRSEGRAPLSCRARDAVKQVTGSAPAWTATRPGPRGRRLLLFNINILTPTSENVHKPF